MSTTYPEACPQAVTVGHDGRSLGDGELAVELTKRSSWIVDCSGAEIQTARRQDEMMPVVAVTLER